MMPITDISFESLNFSSLYPMLSVIVGALIILCIDLLKKDIHKSFYIALSVFFILIDASFIWDYSGGMHGFFDLVLLDGVAILSQIIILIASALFILLALSQQRFHEYRYPEYFALFLFMIGGFQFMVSSSNLVLIFIGLETASLALYVMIAMHNRDKSTEAAIKYFTMGALAAGFFAFGSMLLYAATGSIDFLEIERYLIANNFEPFWVVLLGTAFLIVAIGFKLSLVPFHLWAPDVYEGSSSALAGYMSVVPKIAAFIVALRFFSIFVHADNLWVQSVLYLLVLVTMTIPNMIALVQSDIKRMLAYSSISHAGFVMVAILIGTTQGLIGLFFYWTVFLFTNLGAFSMLWIHRQKIDHGYKTDHPFEKFAGLAKKSPTTALIMSIFMLSLAGIPPFGLFWGKMFLISSAINADYIVLAIIMALNSAIAAYYYLKLIVYMFFKNAVENDHVVYMGNANIYLKFVVGIAVIFTIISVFFMDVLIGLISYYVQVSGY